MRVVEQDSTMPNENGKLDILQAVITIMHSPVMKTESNIIGSSVWSAMNARK